MLYSVLNGIKSIAVFMLVGQLILHFTPGSYGKYLRPVLSLVILLQITTGIFGTFRGSIQEEMNRNLTEYEQKLSEFEQSCIEQTRLFQNADEEILNEDIINESEETKKQEEQSEDTTEQETEAVEQEIKIAEIIIEEEQESVVTDR